MAERQKAIGKLLMERTNDQMKAVADRYGLVTNGKIDLRGERVRFNHVAIDLRGFLVEECDLSGSVLTNVVGESVSFSRCVLKRVRITVEKGKKTSFRGASFDEAILDEATLGPRTLDLSESSFKNARLKNVTFNMGKLDKASFEGSQLEDVFFRSAELRGASFRVAQLTRVSFERASLDEADFTGAIFDQMEHWGEPNFDGAIISDELRYQFGIVRNPLQKLDALIANGAFDAADLDVLRSFRERHREFLSNPEVMLIAREYEDELDLALFTKVMKVLKEQVVH